MFCPKCGKEVEDDAVVCIHCGRSLEPKVQDKPEYKESKTGIGVVMGLFLGLIGLVLGIVLYPEGTVARKTFFKAWLITYIVEIAVTVVLAIAVFLAVFIPLLTMPTPPAGV